MPLRTAVLVAAGGALVSFLASVALGLNFIDSLEILGIAGGAAVGVGIVGAIVLRYARGTSIALQSGIVTATSVVAVAAAMVADSGAMFSATSEYGALAAILIVSGTIGVLISLALGIRIDSDRRLLVRATRQAAQGGAVSVDVPETEEFADVAHELERMSAQLDQAQSRERSLDRSRRELVAWVSHDLRTPLARLRAVVEALEDKIADDPETIRTYYRTLDVETKRLTTLIDDLFELSRISAGALQLELESLTLAELVSDIVASAVDLAGQKGVEIDLEIGARPRVRVSPSHLERAFGNLLDNAIRHTPRAGRIDVAVEETPASAMVLVKDSCGGIPAEELGRLLDPSRDPRELQASSSRPGLGLIIARGLVEAHGGELTIENVGDGCCFTISLPRQPDGAATAELAPNL